MLFLSKGKRKLKDTRRKPRMDKEEDDYDDDEDEESFEESDDSTLSDEE